MLFKYHLPDIYFYDSDKKVMNDRSRDFHNFLFESCKKDVEKVLESEIRSHLILH